MRLEPCVDWGRVGRKCYNKLQLWKFNNHIQDNDFIFTQIEKVIQWRIQDFPDFEISAENLLFVKFLLKTHENERNWTERGAFLAPTMDPPMSIYGPPHKKQVINIRYHTPLPKSINGQSMGLWRESPWRQNCPDFMVSGEDWSI